MISNACNVADIFTLPVLKVVHHVCGRQHISSLIYHRSRGLIYLPEFVSPMKRTGPRSGRHIHHEPKKPFLFRGAHNEHSGLVSGGIEQFFNVWDVAATQRSMATQLPTVWLPHQRKLRQPDINDMDEMRLDPTANFASQRGIRCHLNSEQ